MIEIGNSGENVAQTNYFDSTAAIKGLFFVSGNASVMRILVPDIQFAALAEMCTGKICVISRGSLQGKDGLEFMFDDDSDSPFAIHMSMSQTSRILSKHQKPFIVTAWTRVGKIMEWPGKYRVVRTLPCMDPWKAQKTKK